jgi:hypothetical protein
MMNFELLIFNEGILSVNRRNERIHSIQHSTLKIKNQTINKEHCIG